MSAAPYLPCMHLADGWCWPCVTKIETQARRDGIAEAVQIALRMGHQDAAEAIERLKVRG